MSQKHAFTTFQEPTEPGVIDQDLLTALVIDQGPKGEAGRLFLEDGIKLNETKEIRIEFLNILNIDHLWVMSNLVKLKLSNNVIERIENLDALIHLKELDLSFNHIKIMENLNELTKLEVLLLYSNEISAVQGIHNLQELTIFSVGRNKINGWEHVTYLRKFKKLRSLNTCDNPCTKSDGYLDYLFAFIPQLIYYQYKRITSEERQKAVEKYYRKIAHLEEKELKEKEDLDKQQQLEQKVALLSISYVEYLDEDHLFQQMFVNDKEGKDLSMINEDTQNAFEEYRKQFSAVCKDLYEIGMREHVRRVEEIKLFNDTVDKGKEDVQKNARAIVDEVLERKTEIFTEIKELALSIKDEIEIDAFDERIDTAQQLSEEFYELMSQAWTELMSREVILHDQIEDINEIFKINMTDMVNNCLETAQGYFSQMRNVEAEYNDTITSLVLFYVSGFEDESKMPSHLLYLCGDKDILSNNLAASHDLHLQVIDTREDRMVNRLRHWLDEYIEQQVKDETERNRYQILEISHFLEHQRKEFESLQLLQQLRLT